MLGCETRIVQEAWLIASEMKYATKIDFQIFLRD